MATRTRNVFQAVFSVALLFVSPVYADEETESESSPAVVEAEFVDGYFVSRRLASVRITQSRKNSVMLGSGTIIAIASYGEQECGIGISANHITSDGGDTFNVNFVDGSHAGARCIVRNPDEDIMIFVVAASSVIGVAPVADRLETSDAYAVGFPNGVGPNEKQLSYKTQLVIGETDSDREFVRDRWYVEPGNNAWHAGGDSGGGIFHGERLIGVLTHGPPMKGKQEGAGVTVQSAPVGRIRDMLRSNRGKIKQQDCKDGQCTPNGPRDLGWLKPNVDVGVPEKPVRNPEQVENPRRPDITGPFEQRKAIAELQAQVKLLTQSNADLNRRVEALEGSGGTGQPPLPIIDDGIDEAPPPPAADYSSQFESIRQLIKSKTSIDYGPHFDNLKSLVATNKPHDYNADFAELKKLIAANATPPVEKETVIRVKIYGDTFSPVDAIMTAKDGKVLVQVLDAFGHATDGDSYPAGSLVRFKIIKDVSAVATSPAS